MKTLTFEMEDEIFNTLYAGFSRSISMPQETIEVDGEMVTQDKYATDVEHIKAFMIDKVWSEYRKGKKKLDEEANPIDETLVNEVLNNL